MNMYSAACCSSFDTVSKGNSRTKDMKNGHCAQSHMIDGSILRTKYDEFYVRHTLCLAHTACVPSDYSSSTVVVAESRATITYNVHRMKHHWKHLLRRCLFLKQTAGNICDACCRQSIQTHQEQHCQKVDASGKDAWTSNHDDQQRPKPRHQELSTNCTNTYPRKHQTLSFWSTSPVSTPSR